jgi:hypothetical protein
LRYIDPMAEIDKSLLKPSFSLAEAVEGTNFQLTSLVVSPEGIRAPVDKQVALREIEDAQEHLTE